MTEQFTSDTGETAAKRREIIRLIGEGFPIEIKQTVSVKPKGLLGFLKQSKKEVIKHSFLIKEPCLNILDLISKEAANIDMEALNEGNDRAMHKYSPRLARILALAIMGTEYEYKKGDRYVRDEQGLQKIIDIIRTTIRPSEMYSLLELTDLVSNHGDFTNSIRLITGAAKKANLIEEKQPD